MQISVAEFGATERRAPRCAEAVAGPCFAESVSNCTLRLFRPSRVEHDFQGCADWDHNSLFLFSLPLLWRGGTYALREILVGKGACRGLRVGVSSDLCVEHIAQHREGALADAVRGDEIGVFLPLGNLNK